MNVMISTNVIIRSSKLSKVGLRRLKGAVIDEIGKWSLYVDRVGLALHLICFLQQDFVPARRRRRTSPLTRRFAPHYNLKRSPHHQQGRTSGEAYNTHGEGGGAVRLPGYAP